MNGMDHYARLFGMPVEQVFFFKDLTTAQENEVAYHFSSIDASKFVYAVKEDGHLVWSRHKRDALIERIGL
jgi:hypothetical protein